MNSSGTKMRLTLITLGSAVATAAVVFNAFYQKKQFYPSIVYLTKSNPSIAVIYAQAFVAVFLLGKALRKIFFGQLRAAELEHLIEKFWYVITETCLAFTVFRDDFTPKFVALFTFLLFMKAFHWLIEDRVDYMERTPLITFLFHARVISLLFILGTLDSFLIHHAFRTTLASGASVQMVFGFEYSILLAMVVAIILKYILHTIDNQSENPWENKNVYLLYAELVIGFIKCCLYLLFVGVMVKIHTFPLFAIRPMYLAIRSFKKSLSDVILSRRAITYMNTRFPDATTEELNEVDNTCIICREQMLIGKKLPCNHIFHSHCLRSWFQRQQSCPTCRMDVLSPQPATTNAQQHRQQQPPQPHAQQPPPNFPMPGFMGMPPPPAPGFGPFPPPPQPPTASPTSTTQSSQGTDTTVPTVTTSSFTAFNFPPSPPNIPTFMSGVPPYMPPPPFMSGLSFPAQFGAQPGSNINLSSLSEEELRNMEGQERANVEARVRVLRNIHSLLDTVIIHMNQYSQAIQNINHSCGVSNESVNFMGSDRPNLNTTSTSTNLNNTPHTQSPSTSKEEETVLKEIESPSEFFNSSVENIPGNSDVTATNDDDDLIRQRRLNRFNQKSTSSE